MHVEVYQTALTHNSQPSWSLSRITSSLLLQTTPRGGSITCESFTDASYPRKQEPSITSSFKHSGREL